MRALWLRWRALLLFVGLVLAALLVSRPSSAGGWAVYGVVAFTLLGVKGVLSSVGGDARIEDLNAKQQLLWSQRRTSVVVIPVYNEDPEVVLSCVSSCFRQPEVVGVVLVDDCSTDRACQDRVAMLPVMFPAGRIRRIRFDENRGKRWALNAGVKDALAAWPGADLVVTVDSDTVLSPDAVSEAALKLYGDDEIGAVTGSVRARNWKRNVLTRIQDLRYASAFLWERAAYSKVGAVLCVCGSFTVWRRDLLEELVEILVSQEFLGKPCTYGDDRHLTNLALQRRWKVKLAERAQAETLVPENLGHWVRQQSRWAKSFVRETLWALHHLPKGWGLALTVVELVTWIGFTVALVVAVIVVPLKVGQFALLSWLVWVSFMSFARSTRYFDARADAARGDRWAALALAPVYGIVHLLIVLPLRLWALFTIRDVSWGTRASVEVSDVVIDIKDRRSSRA